LLTRSQLLKNLWRDEVTFVTFIPSTTVSWTSLKCTGEQPNFVTVHLQGPPTLTRWRTMWGNA
jgi:hypothetical protein